MECMPSMLRHPDTVSALDPSVTDIPLNFVPSLPSASILGRQIWGQGCFLVCRETGRRCGRTSNVTQLALFFLPPWPIFDIGTLVQQPLEKRAWSLDVRFGGGSCSEPCVAGLSRLRRRSNCRIRSNDKNAELRSRSQCARNGPVSCPGAQRNGSACLFFWVVRPTAEVPALLFGSPCRGIA